MKYKKSLIFSFCLLSFIGIMHFTPFQNYSQNLFTKLLPKELGIKVNFKKVSFQLFPMRLIFFSPILQLEKNNALHLPENSSIQADQIHLELTFLPLLWGSIEVENIKIQKGKTNLKIDRLQSIPINKKFQFSDLLTIKIRHIRFLDSDFTIAFDDILFNTHTDYLELKRKKINSLKKRLPGYSLNTQLQEVLFEKKNLKIPFQSVNAKIFFSEKETIIKSLSVNFQSIILQLDGAIKDNILAPSLLASELNLKTTGDLKSINNFLKNPIKNISGEFVLKTSLQGPLLKDFYNIHTNTDFEFKKIDYEEFQAETLHGKAHWNGKHLKFTDIHIQDHLQPRTIDQSGHGGNIHIPYMLLSWSKNILLEAQANLSKAHLHWLLKPWAKKIFYLDTRLSGNVKFIAQANDQGFLSAKIEHALTTERFILDNQKLHIKSNIIPIFSVAEMALAGQIEITPRKIRIAPTTVRLPHSHFSLEGFVQDKKIQLLAHGNAQLKDIESIANIPIQGASEIKVHVHGPSNKIEVDIEHKTQNAFYLGLFLGNIKGNIQYKDATDQIVFQEHQIQYPKTTLNTFGQITFKKGNENISFKVKGDQADVGELFFIFHPYIYNQIWYPKNLSGLTQLQASITGGLSFDSLNIDVTAEGRSWKYFNEIIQKTTLSGGLKKGIYQLKALEAHKHEGFIKGSFEYQPNKILNWNILGENFMISDFDALVQKDLPLNGILHLQSFGTKEKGFLESHTKVTLKKLHTHQLEVKSYPDSFLDINIQDDTTKIFLNLFNGQSIIKSVITNNLSKKSKIEASFQDFDFTPILSYLNPKTLFSKGIESNLTGGLALHFPGYTLSKAQGAFQLTKLHLKNSYTFLETEKKTKGLIEDGNCQLEPIILRSRKSRLKIDFASKKNSLFGLLKGLCDASIIEFFIPSITKAKGIIELNGSLRGTWKDPIFQAEALLKKENTFMISGLDAAVQEVSGAIKINANQLQFQNFQGALGGGTFSLAGGLKFFVNKQSMMNILLNAQNVKIKMYPFQIATLSTALHIEGNTAPYFIHGTADIHKALSTESIRPSIYQQTRRAAIYEPPKLHGITFADPLFKFDIRVNLQNNIQIVNNIFESKSLNGTLQIVNFSDNPVILGKVIIDSGKLKFKNHYFDIQHASLTFNNPNQISPHIQLSAVTETSGYKIQVFLSGPIDRLKLELTSNPSLSQMELLNLLMVGISVVDSKKLKGSDIAAVQRGEAAALFLQTLDVNKNLEDSTGFTLYVDKSYNTQLGASAFRPQALSETTAAPQVLLKKSLMNELQLIVGSTVGVGTNDARQVNLNYLINRNFSINGVFNSLSGVNTLTLPQNSYGFDFRFQQRIK